MKKNILDDYSTPAKKSSNALTCVVIFFLLLAVLIFLIPHLLTRAMGSQDLPRPKPQQSESSQKK